MGTSGEISVNSVHWRFFQIKEVKSMVKHLFELSGGGLHAVEVRSVFFKMMFNVLTRMIAGKKYYEEESEKSEEAKQFQGIVKGTARLASVLRWFWFKDLENKFVEVSKRRDEFMQNLIDEFCGSGYKGESKTLIQILLDLHVAEPDYYTNDDIRNLMQMDPLSSRLVVLSRPDQINGRRSQKARPRFVAAEAMVEAH